MKDQHRGKKKRFFFLITFLLFTSYLSSITFKKVNYKDISIVGIGSVAREIQKRFLNTLESVYYFHPLDNLLVVHSYSSPWYIYSKEKESHKLISEKNEKPNQEELDLLITNEIVVNNSNFSQTSKTGFINEIQRFIDFLSK